MKLTDAGTPQEILVVDDETSVCEFLTRALGEDNFRVTAMTDASSLQGAVLDRKPCLVILDLHLEGRNGLEVFKEMKVLAPEMPVVIVSGDPDPEVRAEAKRLGACEFLSKPINWNTLRNIAYLSAFLKESTRV